MQEEIYTSVQPLFTAIIYFAALRNISHVKAQTRVWVFTVLASSLMLYHLIYTFNLGEFVNLFATFFMFLFLIWRKKDVLVSLLFASITGFIVMIVSYGTASIFSWMFF